MKKPSTGGRTDCWALVAESFDTSLPRLEAILIKESTFSRFSTYPDHWNSVGYCFDFSERTSYDNPPRFRIDFAAFVHPDLRGTAGLNKVIYGACTYYPSLIERCYRFTNLGLDCTERMGMAVEGALAWHIHMDCINERIVLPKSLFTVISSEEEFAVVTDGDSIGLVFHDLQYHVAVRPASGFGVYPDECAAKRSIETGDLDRREDRGSCLVIRHDVVLLPGKSIRIAFGLSSVSAAKAREGIATQDIVETVRRPWNRWFGSLPAVRFRGSRERKAYYKAWWTIRLNYYDHPSWGHCVLEALPVYKGVWQWSMPAVEWHSDQDPEHPSVWTRTAMNLLLGNQREDGYVSHAIYIDEKKPGERWSKGGIVQTPHLPWVAVRYYRVTGDREPLERWYQSLCRYYSYLCETRDTALLGIHLWGILDSCDTGLDVTPAFDRIHGAEGGKESYCYPAVFAAERCRYEQAMGELARILGQDAGPWEAEWKATREAMDRVLWDTCRHWYGVRHQDGTLDTRIGVDGLFPLAYNLVDDRRAESMEQNFRSLLGPFGVRSVAPEEPGYHANTYWRGPSWSKTCSLGMEACRRYYPHLLEAVHDGVIRMVLAHPGIWECVNASSGEIARADYGFVCTPCVSSNVGAGDVLGSLLLFHGYRMYSTDDALPLVEMKRFHWNGVRVSMTKRKETWRVHVDGAEAQRAHLSFVDDDGTTHELDAIAGHGSILAALPTRRRR